MGKTGRYINTGCWGLIPARGTAASKLKQLDLSMMGFQPVPHDFAFNESAALCVVAEDTPHVGILDEEEVREKPVFELRIEILGRDCHFVKPKPTVNNFWQFKVECVEMLHKLLALGSTHGSGLDLHFSSWKPRLLTGFVATRAWLMWLYCAHGFWEWKTKAYLQQNGILYFNRFHANQPDVCNTWTWT